MEIGVSQRCAVGADRSAFGCGGGTNLIWTGQCEEGRKQCLPAIRAGWPADKKWAERSLGSSAEGTAAR